MTDYFLSRVELNARKRGARKLLMSPQAMHAAVESSLPPSARRPGERFLWRVDQQGPQNALYVVSPGRPDFTHVVEQAGWHNEDGDEWVTRPYGPLLSRLAAGQVWAFRLAANPTHIGRTPEGRKKRFAHVTVAQQVEWLLSRSSSYGFTVAEEARPSSQASGDGPMPQSSPKTEDRPAVEVVSRSDLRFSRTGSAKPVSLRRAVFEGILAVTDPGALGSALVNGIGRAKAYGCGLMTLAPVSVSSRPH